MPIPQEFMDEVVENNSWYFGRKDNGYVAIRPISGKTAWIDPDPAFYPYMGIEAKNEKGEENKIKPYEISAEGRSNAWICELGSKEQSGSFHQFIDRISAAKFYGDVFNMTYVSPTQGRITLDGILHVISTAKRFQQMGIHDMKMHTAEFLELKNHAYQWAKILTAA